MQNKINLAQSYYNRRQYGKAWRTLHPIRNQHPLAAQMLAHLENNHRLSFMDKYLPQVVIVTIFGGIMMFCGLVVLVGLLATPDKPSANDNIAAETVAVLPTNRPTRTPTRTHYASPTKVSENQMLTTVLHLMDDNDLIILEMKRNGDTLNIDASASNSNYDTALDYRMSFMGAITGALVSGYEDYASHLDPPQKLVVEFKSGSVIAVRVTVSYFDMKKFINGDLTSAQFVLTWQVE